MTTDREYAEVLRNHQGADDFVWLAAIKRAIEALDEVERLRTALFGSADEFVILAPEDFKTLVAERAAALAECERLRAELARTANRRPS